MKSKIKRRKFLFRAIFALLLCAGVGFAALAANIDTDGNARIANNKWNIHIESVKINEGSVDTHTVPEVSGNTDGEFGLEYEFSFDRPGQMLSYNIVVKNSGSLDGILNEFYFDVWDENYCDEETGECTTPYLSNSITKADGSEVSAGEILRSGESITYTITTLYRDDIDPTLLPTADSEIYVDCYFSFIETSNKLDIWNFIDKNSNGEVASYQEGDPKKMYQFNNEATTQVVPGKRYIYTNRYIGSNPDNYITYNNETWRIIGVASRIDNGTGGDERTRQTRIKIIRQDPLTQTYAWGNGVENEWSNGIIDTTLNTNRVGNYFNTLSTEAKRQAGSVVYYLAGNTDGTIAAANFFENERGSQLFNDTRSLNVARRLGLLYVSDYAYTFGYGVDDNCFNDITTCSNPSASWLYNSSSPEWTIDTSSTSGDKAYSITASGNVELTSVANTLSIRPVVYLKEDVKLTGSGTEQDPFKIYYEG